MRFLFRHDIEHLVCLFRVLGIAGDLAQVPELNLGVGGEGGGRAGTSTMMQYKCMETRKVSGHETSRRCLPNCADERG